MLAAFAPFDAVLTPTTLAGAPLLEGLDLNSILATVAAMFGLGFVLKIVLLG